MTPELYIDCAIACLIGNIIHLCAKWASLSKDYQTAGIPFTLRDWWKIDRFAFLFNFVGSMGLVFIAGEWLDSAYILGKIKTAFVIVGFTGSYAIMFISSRAKRAVRGKVDVATDVLDGKKTLEEAKP